NQGVTYAELKAVKNSKRQKIKPKKLTYVELKLQNASQNLHRDDKNYHSKASPSPPEKLIDGILGIICLVLMPTVEATIVVTPSTVIQGQNTSSLIFTYSNNCYSIRLWKKELNESLMSCTT
ncbi:hypothetical protein FD755_023792, partial [Muntiacus reevesi]